MLVNKRQLGLVNPGEHVRKSKIAPDPLGHLRYFLLFQPMQPQGEKLCREQKDGRLLRLERTQTLVQEPLIQAAGQLLDASADLLDGQRPARDVYKRQPG